MGIDLRSLVSAILPNRWLKKVHSLICIPTRYVQGIHSVRVHEPSVHEPCGLLWARGHWAIVHG